MERASDVYLLWFRVEPLPGCKVLPDAFDPELECALRAASPDDARTRLERSLHHHRYALAELEACVPYRPEVWDGAEPATRVRAAVDRAAHAGEPVYGSFGPPPQGR